MNAEARIHVERKQQALQVPVQALAEHKGHFYSLVKEGDSYKTREVSISSTNDKVATIEKGLVKGDEVVMNPRSASTLLVLPNLPDPAPTQMADIKLIEGGGPFMLATNKSGGAAPGGDKGKGGKGGKGTLTVAAFLERYLESDADKDGKLSKEELASMDEKRRQTLAPDADKDHDGFLSKAELTPAATASFQKMLQRQNSGEGGGRGGGGPGGPGGGRGGPAGGGE